MQLWSITNHSQMDTGTFYVKGKSRAIRKILRESEDNELEGNYAQEIWAPDTGLNHSQLLG